VLGERQSGYSDLRLTHLMKDLAVLQAARKEAFSLIDDDPQLLRHPKLNLEMQGRYADRLDWLLRS
jgi:ATP-dependent DNA helicase RecG